MWNDLTGLWFFNLPPAPFHQPSGSSGRRDFAPYTTPAQSHHPLRGFVEDWRPREFRVIQELCPMEPVRLPKFTSGRRDLNPGPLPHQGSALPGCLSG